MFDAVAESSRRDILMLPTRGESAVGDLVDRLDDLLVVLQQEDQPT